VNLAETCRCSGAFTVDADPDDARAALAEWRRVHPCDGKIPYGTATKLHGGQFELAQPIPFGFVPEAEPMPEGGNP
jgi:hypothetical protein